MAQCKRRGACGGCGALCLLALAGGLQSTHLPAGTSLEECMLSSLPVLHSLVVPASCAAACCGAQRWWCMLVVVVVMGVVVWTHWLRAYSACCQHTTSVDGGGGM